MSRHRMRSRFERALAVCGFACGLVGPATAQADPVSAPVLAATDLAAWRAQILPRVDELGWEEIPKLASRAHDVLGSG